MTKRILEYCQFTTPTKIIIIGGVCSGKTTISKLFQELGFKHISIDKFRFIYSNGTIQGENIAYNKFIEYANNYTENCIIECTGLSYRYNELEKHMAHFIYLECETIDSKYRQVDRELEGYPLIPFPYQIKNNFDLSNVEFEDKIGYPLDLMYMYNTSYWTPTEILSDLLIRWIGHRDTSSKPTQKQLYENYKYREYEKIL